MVQQECPACGKTIKSVKKFCIYCGTKLSEVSEAVTTSGAPSQLPIKGWEVSPDRINYYDKIMAESSIGDPIITSKCDLDSNKGFLVVTDNGFAWRLRLGAWTPLWKAGSGKWMRWHDVSDIIPIKNGQIRVEIKIRKAGALIVDGKGNLKIKKWKLTIKPHKGEPNPQFNQRLESFHNIMSEIYNRNKVETDPPTSDSRM